MLNLTSRQINLLGFLICLGLSITAYYMQYAMNLEPCPLCIMQRVVFVALGMVFLLATLHNPQQRGKTIYGFLLVLISITGMGFAGRQLWLQHLPAAQVPGCGPGLEYMIKHLPLTATIKTLFMGSGKCAEISWRFLGLSIPGWTLLSYIALAGLGVWQTRRR